MSLHRFDRWPPAISSTGISRVVTVRTVATARAEFSWSLARNANASNEITTHQNPTPRKIPPASKQLAERTCCVAWMNGSKTTIRRSIRATSVNRPPTRLTTIPTTGLETTRVSRFVDRIGPINDRGRPSRRPTKGRIGNLISVAILASNKAALRARAIRRGGWAPRGSLTVSPPTVALTPRDVEKCSRKLAKIGAGRSGKDRHEKSKVRGHAFFCCHVCPIRQYDF
jgi:hypothetical protein